MSKQIFVTGIDTEVGKTVISAILVQALGANYWKPVQSGDLDNTDTDKVKAWTNHPHTVFHPETYRLHTPMSPHASAEIDGVEIRLDQFKLPETTNKLVVEGAGGLMVPLNDKDNIIDLIQQLQIPVVLVSRNYLGSINHTLLSIEALQQRNIPILGLVFNDKPTPTTEEIILKKTGLPCLFRVPEVEEVSAAVIQKLASSVELVF